MEDVEKHAEEFKRIIEQYNLKDPEKAEEIAHFLTKSHGKDVSAKEFAQLFNMDEKDAALFLSFIERGLKFKQDHLDKK